MISLCSSQMKGSVRGRLPEAQPEAQPVPSAPEPPGGVSIFTALQDELGLKLESGKGPIENIVIDHIGKEHPEINGAVRHAEAYSSIRRKFWLAPLHSRVSPFQPAFGHASAPQNQSASRSSARQALTSLPLRNGQTAKGQSAAGDQACSFLVTEYTPIAPTSTCSFPMPIT